MLENGNVIGLFAIVPILLYLLILGFIYFIVRTIRFMNEKTKLDQARNDKLDALIKTIQDRKS
jgi:hypothetical protein